MHFGVSFLDVYHTSYMEIRNHIHTKWEEPTPNHTARGGIRVPEEGSPKTGIAEDAIRVPERGSPETGMPPPYLSCGPARAPPIRVRDLGLLLA